ncbi:unnamed protein product, partial [Symbiodinium sp. KB8]
MQNPEDWNSLLSKAVQHFYPRPTRTETVALEAVTRRMWRAKINAGEPSGPSLAASVPDLPLASGTPAQPPSHLPAQPSSMDTESAPASADHQQPSAQEQHRRAAKQAQKDRVSRFLAEVDQSIAEGDQHAAFKTFKLLKPWQPARRAQLKSDSGHILSPQEELSTLSRYAKDIFAAHPPLYPARGMLPHLTPADLAKHIHSIKPGKAVPEGSAPAAAWRLCSHEIATAMSSYARDLISKARPSRHEQHAGVSLPDLAGGVTFALDLSQAFNTVSRQDIIDNLAQLVAPSEVVRLVHALHHHSKYRLQTQGESAWVETTAGIKQGRLFTALTDTFGVESVVNFLTGYADDLTLQRTICKVADLKAIHSLIAGLLEEVWNSRVLSTLLTGLADTGLTPESARALRDWHAHKVTSVLNQPAHISRVSTSDLFALHGISDPVQQVLMRLKKRLRKLSAKARRGSDITTSEQVLQCLRDKIAAIEQLPVPDK